MKVVLISVDESKNGVGVRTLSACLREAGFETHIVFMATLDDCFAGFHWEDLIAICQDAGLFGISCMTLAVRMAVEVKKRLEEKLDIPVIAGGIHASMDPESLLSHFAYICHGEGEDLIVEFARRLQNHASVADIPGLWGHAGGERICNPAVPLRRDINQYPLPDYDLAHQHILEADRLVQARPVPGHISIDNFVVLGSRGCPHKCAYCCNSRIKECFPWRRKVFQYSVDSLIRHMAAIRRIFPEVRSFWIEDDTFFAKDLSEIGIFAQRYRAEIAMPFMILISPWTYDRDKLEVLIDAGLTSLIMGIQSGSERINRELYHRHMTNEKLLDIANSLSMYENMLPCYDFIGMNPFEHRPDLIDTIRFMRRLPAPCRIFNNSLAFYPGTELHSRAINSSMDISLRVKHTDASVGYDIMIFEPLPHKVFHLLLLMMGGTVTPFQIGRVPRVLVTDRMIRIYTMADEHFPRVCNAAAFLVAAMCRLMNWRKVVKRLLPTKAIVLFRRFFFHLRKVI